jgi:hypothetical protein
LSTATWVIPAERMKADMTHRVAFASSGNKSASVGALSRGRLEIHFEGLKKKPLSDMSLGKVLKLMDVPVTAHGAFA